MIGGVLKRHIKGHKEMVDHNRDAVGGHENHNNHLAPTGITQMQKKPFRCHQAFLRQNSATFNRLKVYLVLFLLLLFI